MPPRQTEQKGGGRVRSRCKAFQEGGVAVNYGLFVNNVISFLIVAFAVFLLVKGINRLRRQQIEAPTPPTAPPEDILLLREIRDALNKER